MPQTDLSASGISAWPARSARLRPMTRMPAEQYTDGMTVSIHSDRFRRRAAEGDEPREEAATAPARGHHEQFPFSYLPENMRDTFEEALQCYSADLFNAFGLMCRHIVAVSADKDKSSEQMRAAVEEIIRIGEVDENAAQHIESLLFGNVSQIAGVDPSTAAILLEVMKDVLYQRYVRAARFRTAMRVRRFFAEEHSATLTSLRRQRGSTQPRS